MGPDDLLALHQILEVMYHPTSKLSQFQQFFNSWDPTLLHPLAYEIRMCTHLLVLYIFTLNIPEACILELQCDTVDKFKRWV